MVHDFKHIARVFQAHRLQRSQLTEMRDVLAGNGPCFLITDSFTIADGLHTVQRYRPLEYAEIMTGCRLLNGSFVQRGAEGGRAMDGLPDAALFASLPADATVLLIVPEPVEARYRSGLPNVTFGSSASTDLAVVTAPKCFGGCPSGVVPHSERWRLVDGKARGEA